MTPTPTQVARPWRASLRTGAQTFLAVLVALVALAPYVQEFVETVAPGSPVVGWVTAGAGIAAALATLITRVMALERVNAVLTIFGLGAAPKDYGAYTPGGRITDL